MTDEDQKLQEEINNLAMRSSSLGGVGGVLSTGGGSLSGGSPVPILIQNQSAAKSWIKNHLKDTDGALLAVFIRQIGDADVLFGKDPDHPLHCLLEYLERFKKESALVELVRQADMEYGQSMGERPIFQAPGAPEKPNDPYTHQSVRKTIEGLVCQLKEELA